MNTLWHLVLTYPMLTIIVLSLVIGGGYLRYMSRKH